MELELEGKVVVVTGGSNGLGRALCLRLASERARVAFCGRDEERIEVTRTEVEALGGEVLATRADVTKAADLARFVDATLERWGRIDGLVNNAGQSAGKPLVDISDEEWEADISLKLYAAARLCRRTMEHLAVRGGSIVNVLAIGGKTPGASSMPSSVSRAAGMALTKALSKEAGPHGVRVNAVLIGLIESGQWERRADSSGTPVEQLYETMAKNSGIPLGRVGRAEEFADLVAFLLSPARRVRDRAPPSTSTAGSARWSDAMAELAEALAPLQGTVVSVAVSEGDAVAEGQALVVLESMKMEHVVVASSAGTVRGIGRNPGDTVEKGDPLVTIELGEVADVRADVDRPPRHGGIRPELAELMTRRDALRDESRPEAMARRHGTGHRSARENLADLCDEGSFVEYGGFVVAAQRRRRSVEELIERTPGDGLVAGLGHGQRRAVRAARRPAARSCPTTTPCSPAPRAS